MLVVLIGELFCHVRSKNVPLSQTKSLIGDVKLFLSNFNTWIGEFHHNWSVLTDAPPRWR